MSQLYRQILDAFNDAFNHHDVSTMMSLMTDDCIFENTYPPPDGMTYTGQPAVRIFWEEFFRSSPQAHIDFEEIFFSDDRAVQRWAYTWGDAQGVAGHVRGVDVIRFREGKIAEKLSYVKG